MKPFFRTLSVLLTALLLTGCSPAEAPPTTVLTAPPSTVEIPETTIPPETTLPPETEPLFPEPGDHPLRYDSEATGDYLEYYLHIPEGVTEGMPLVIFLHGDNEVDHMEGLSSPDYIANARGIYGDALPFIALTPCTRQISWVLDPIRETLMELIEYTVETCQIDREKIILTGHSRGAIGTWNLISLYGSYFSAAVPISCDCGDRVIDYKKAAEVPVWAFVGGQGDLDTKYYPAINYMCAQINHQGGSAELTVLWEDYHGDTCEHAFTDQLFTWILAQ